MSDQKDPPPQYSEQDPQLQQAGIPPSEGGGEKHEKYERPPQVPPSAPPQASDPEKQSFQPPPGPPGPQGQFQQQGQNLNNGPPDVYYVQPQLVNITQAPPQHLNPQYQEYLARDQERMKYGDFPKGREYFKHGAPLAPGHKSSKKTGGFPGSSGATYHSAANR